MKFYQRANESCVEQGCKCVDCLLNHKNEKHCCFNCASCSRKKEFGNQEYDHIQKDCGMYMKRGKKENNNYESGISKK